MVEPSIPTTDLNIYFVPYEKQELYRFDSTTLKTSLAISPKNIELGYAPHMCPLSSTSLFMHGGILNYDFTSNTFIVDLNTENFEEKESGPTNGAGGCIKFNQNIFIFGGAAQGSYNPLNSSQKYSIKDNT